MAIDLTGKTFGRLTVLRYAHHRSGKRYWDVKCACGKELTARGTSLTTGQRKTCGCAVSDSLKARNHRHGHAGMPTYLTWNGMIQRCTNPKHRRYADYGGRGIKVHPPWRIFDNFLRDVGERPDGKTLDRIDVNGNYEPGNVRWATIKEQNANKRKGSK